MLCRHSRLMQVLLRRCVKWFTFTIIHLNIIKQHYCNFRETAHDRRLETEHQIIFASPPVGSGGHSSNQNRHSPSLSDRKGAGTEAKAWGGRK